MEGEGGPEMGTRRMGSASVNLQWESPSCSPSISKSPVRYSHPGKVLKVDADREKNPIILIQRFPNKNPVYLKSEVPPVKRLTGAHKAFNDMVKVSFLSIN